MHGHKTDLLANRIGIIGGGQLGKMMIAEAKKMGMYVSILDPTSDCPAHSVADYHIVAAFDDRDGIRALAERSDVITYELEHIGVDVLMELEEEGTAVYPTPKSLRVIQDKYLQKCALRENNIPVPDFVLVEDECGLWAAAEAFGYPLVLKTLRGGYDGKGNALVRNKDEAVTQYLSLKGCDGMVSIMAERFISFDREISVLACRGTDGMVAVYPVAENTHEDNILLETRVPANISDEISRQAMKLAEKVMGVFEGVGMFCVEMFSTRDGVYINEVAPRPHNSGHYTIEACLTSQFEQHIRAICGMPLGETSLIRPVVMRNILGELGYRGAARVIGVREALAVDGVKLHIYGKAQTSAKRKMGHITVCAKSMEGCVKAADEAMRSIRVIGDVKTRA